MDREEQDQTSEMLDIINLIQGWAGGTAQAMAWLREEPVPAFGGRTAEAMIKSGNAAAVRAYLDHLQIHTSRNYLKNKENRHPGEGRGDGYL